MDKRLNFSDFLQNEFYNPRLENILSEVVVFNDNCKEERLNYMDNFFENNFLEIGIHLLNIK